MPSSWTLIDTWWRSPSKCKAAKTKQLLTNVSRARARYLLKINNSYHANGQKYYSPIVPHERMSQKKVSGIQDEQYCAVRARIGHEKHIEAVRMGLT